MRCVSCVKLLFNFKILTKSKKNRAGDRESESLYFQIALLLIHV
jgi:hypothetical protein